MRKKFKNALIVGVAGICASGLVFASACSDYYKSKALDGDYSYTSVVSNGGFAVEAGNYVYFINGVEESDADNSYGDVQKGSILRISVDNLSAGNYSDVDTVVPLVIYSDNYDAGLYIYGDYIYYSTPSTSRDSSGEVQSDLLEFKRTKLDGTETMKSYYYQGTPDDYRIVEVDGTVYLLYAITESLYGEDEDVTNIHSINYSTGEDTILAYNVSDYVFDTEDPTNPYVYYTMGVTYNLGTDNEVDAKYNQVYRACADATEDTAQNTYDFSYVDDYDADEDPLYINLGELVFDGIGNFDMLTQFNYGYDSSTGYTEVSNVNTLTGFVYTLCSYENGILYYYRENYDSNDSSLATPVTLYITDSQYEKCNYVTGNTDASSGIWNAITQNPTANDTDSSGSSSTSSTSSSSSNLYSGKVLLYGSNENDGNDITDYTVIPDDYDNPTKFNVVYTEENSGSVYAIMYGVLSGGTLDTSAHYDSSTAESYNTSSSNDKDNPTYNTYVMTYADAEITIYGIYEEKVCNGSDNESDSGSETTYKFLYYGVSGEGNNYSVHRIALGGSQSEYNQASILKEGNYYDQRICDLDVETDWYLPEIIEGQFLFASSTDDMTDYNYIMAFDLRDSSSTSSSIVTMSNDELGAISELYDGVLADIEEYEDDDDYENLSGMLYYAFYTGDTDYIYDLIALWEDEGVDMDTWLSAESLLVYKSFVDPTQTATGKKQKYAEAFADYKEYSRTVNGETVYATSRSYYYNLIGYMSEDDYEEYIEAMQDDYCYAAPTEGTWFEELSTIEKVFFITGVGIAGLAVISAAALAPIFIIRKRRKNRPSLRRRSMRVDITDDKSIDVYGDPYADGEPPSDGQD